MAPTNQPAEITITELATLVAEALGSGYEGVRSGRVRQVPDARTIRWYQTLGMVERPAAFRGRTALFTRRHVAQLAAIKKLQAAALPLTDIQQALAGRTDAELARAAGISLKNLDSLIAAATAARSKANAARLTAALSPTLDAAPRPATAFWKHRPADVSAAVPAPLANGALQTLTLAGSVALLWNGRPLTAAEAVAVGKLARPLIELLSSCAAGSAAEPSPVKAPSSTRPRTEARS